MKITALFDDADFLAALNQEVKTLPLEGINELRVLGEMIVKEAKGAAPIGPGKDGRTHMRDTIMSEEGGGLFPYIDVGTRDPVGLYNEFGTKPHMIRATKARVLTNGQEFFGKVVNHPGTPAKPFLRPAIERSIAAWRVMKAL